MTHQDIDRDEVLDLFRSAGALLEGHFLLTSGLHSARYLQSALVLSNPSHASRLGAALSGRLTQLAGPPDVVLAPALGGILVAHEVARAAGVRGLFAERQGGVLALRRGFALQPGERCFVVEDVVTTGGSTLETIALARASGALVCAAGSLIDRTGGTVDLGVPRTALAVLDVPAYTADACPLCASGSRPVKPGSR